MSSHWDRPYNWATEAQKLRQKLREIRTLHQEAAQKTAHSTLHWLPSSTLGHGSTHTRSQLSSALRAARLKRALIRSRCNQLLRALRRLTSKCSLIDLNIRPNHREKRKSRQSAQQKAQQLIPIWRSSLTLGRSSPGIRGRSSLAWPARWLSGSPAPQSGHDIAPPAMGDATGWLLPMVPRGPHDSPKTSPDKAEKRPLRD